MDDRNHPLVDDEAIERNTVFPINHGECIICGKPIIQRSFADMDYSPVVVNHIEYAHHACVERALRDGAAVRLPRAYERFHTPRCTEDEAMICTYCEQQISRARGCDARGLRRHDVRDGRT